MATADYENNEDFWNKPAATDGKPKFHCPNCNSTNIESHPASGASVCTDCGVVVEENAIVNQLDFAEGNGGASEMVGQFVTQSGKVRSQGGGRGQRYGFGSNSREMTLATGRRKIQEVANRLRLSQHFVDSAHRLYTIAVERNFTQGRRRTHVVAACLYISCRQEKSQHMLIDFSDALQVNVYTLGTTFLKFRRLLGIKLSIIDPALYVYRFAAHLDLGDKANAVALTALRIVGRMKRDWIVVGRRPAGICASALLISSRAHGFTRNEQDVTKILRICGMTVLKRMREFESTPSSTLTLEQFNNVDISTECDPPRFTRNRFLEARATAIQEGNKELIMSGELDDPRQGKRKDKWRELINLSTKEKELEEVYKKLEVEMKEGDKEEEETKPGQISVYRGNHAVTLPGNVSIKYPKGNYGPLRLPNQASPEELQISLVKTQEKLDLGDWKSHMPSQAADEIESMFRDEDETAQREAVFNVVNKEFLEILDKKQQDREDAEVARKEKDKDESAQTERREKYGKKRKKVLDDDGNEITTEDALISAVSTRKISRKINYDAMSSIFDQDGEFSTSLLEDTKPDHSAFI